MIKEFIKKRLKEPSTWRALVGLVTVFGVTLSPEQKEAIATAGAAIYCLIGAFTPDKIAKKAEPEAESIPEPVSQDPDPVVSTADAEKWDGKVNGQFP